MTTWRYASEKEVPLRTDEEQVTQLVSRIAEWWNNANWHAEYENMSPNFKKLVPYERFVNHQNAFLTVLLDLYGPGKIEVADIEVRVEGEFAYASYVIKIGGTTLPLKEDIYRKVGGRWYKVEDEPLASGYNEEDLPGGT